MECKRQEALQKLQRREVFQTVPSLEPKHVASQAQREMVECKRQEAIQKRRQREPAVLRPNPALQRGEWHRLCPRCRHTTEWICSSNGNWFHGCSQWKECKSAASQHKTQVVVQLEQPGESFTVPMDGMEACPIPNHQGLFALQDHDRVMDWVQSRLASSVGLVRLSHKLVVGVLEYRAAMATPSEVSDRMTMLHERAPKLSRALLAFQRTGVEFGLARHGRVLIGEEMGVGKTIQAVARAFW
eukprot:TRINITY_DN49738_c0_g1_i1.p1 TRINITY_DN49738_c0_g1~~TRINITY_DN49738_c0_g1_i1.p1  ORF type:complete len:243 (-),score=42.29 TRINITY_DN49738_c0_g1_i1:39-767(-)